MGVHEVINESTVAVSRSIEAAVRSAIRTGRRRVRWYPVGHFGGGQDHGPRGSRPASLAWASWLAASGAPVPAAAGAVVRDFVAASQAGWWWPHTRFVVISERPSALRLDKGRLHSTDGPAAEWPDGYRIYAAHGTMVPADLIEDGGDVKAIRRHPNSDVRQAAIEMVGWADYIQRAGWRLVATAPDPGNPPHELALYEDPNRRLRDVRVLVMTSGSPDSSSELRRHAETVPGTIDDPVEAAARQYGCPVEVYRQLQRPT